MKTLKNILGGLLVVTMFIICTVVAEVLEQLP